MEFTFDCVGYTSPVTVRVNGKNWVAVVAGNQVADGYYRGEPEGELRQWVNYTLLKGIGW